MNKDRNVSGAPPGQAGSGGQRSKSGSNYGNWRPDSKDNKTSQPGSAPTEEVSVGLKAKRDGAKQSPSGLSPSTAPSGIGSTPHK